MQATGLELQMAEFNEQRPCQLLVLLGCCFQQLQTTKHSRCTVSRAGATV
jgi:hypothetical protein